MSISSLVIRLQYDLTYQIVFHTCSSVLYQKVFHKTVLAVPSHYCFTAICCRYLFHNSLYIEFAVTTFWFCKVKKHTFILSSARIDCSNLIVKLTFRVYRNFRHEFQKRYKKEVEKWNQFNVGRNILQFYRNLLSSFYFSIQFQLTKSTCALLSFH